jgi:hypothetical protein
METSIRKNNYLKFVLKKSYKISFLLFEEHLQERPQQQSS